MTDKLPPQWALDQANVVLEYIRLSVSDYTRKTVVAMIATMLVEERERCAKICEKHGRMHPIWLLALVRDVLDEAAVEIRSNDVDI